MPPIETAVALPVLFHPLLPPVKSSKSVDEPFGVAVATGVGVRDGVAVGTRVDVAIGVDVFVGCGVEVAVGVFVDVGAAVAVAGIDVRVAVGVFVDVGAAVAVAVGVTVPVGVLPETATGTKLMSSTSTVIDVADQNRNPRLANEALRSKPLKSLSGIVIVCH